METAAAAVALDAAGLLLRFFFHKSERYGIESPYNEATFVMETIKMILVLTFPSEKIKNGKSTNPLRASSTQRESHP